MNLNKLNALLHQYHPKASGAFQYHRTGGTCYIYFRACPAAHVVDTLINLMGNVHIVVEDAA